MHLDTATKGNLKWIAIGLVVLALVVAVAYYGRAPSPGTAPAGGASSGVTGVPAPNPLLGASGLQFAEWYPADCDTALYVDAAVPKSRRDFCIEQVISRVHTATGIRLTAADVLDERVKAHWQEARPIR